MFEAELQTLFEPDLLKDERILWTGQPDPSVHFIWADRFWISAGLLGALAGLGAYHHFITESGALFGLILGIFLLTYGLYVLVGRFIFKSLRKRRTFYALTNRRALVLKDARKRILRAINLNRIPVIAKTVRADGVGTLYFGTVASAGVFYFFGNTGMEWPWPFVQADALAFFDICDAEHVYDLLKSLI